MIQQRTILAASCVFFSTTISFSNAFRSQKTDSRLSIAPGSKESLSYFPNDSSSFSSSSSRGEHAPSQPLHMQQSSVIDLKTKRTLGLLSSVSIADDWNTENTEEGKERQSINSKRHLLNRKDSLSASVLPVLSTALLITGNTVGAGMLVLPELATGPGMGLSTSIFVGAFLINLLSGLVLAEVAINQHDSSGDDVPSSFKEFAEANLNSSSAANWIAGVSVFVNALVFAFNLDKIGEVGATAMGVNGVEHATSLAFAAACVVVTSTQSFANLSNVTSLFVTGLFCSFVGLIIPGLAHMTTDPMTLLMTPGTSADAMASAGALAPVVLMSLIYQNIVPTVAKILNYDRTKTTVSLVLGSFVPLVMYVAWAFAVVGGGVDTSMGLNGPLMSIFSVCTIAGSSLGCSMSLAEEFDTYLKKKPQEDNATAAAQPSSNMFSVPAVLASMGATLLASTFFANDFTAALGVAGSFGSPLLYGAIPVAMAYTQRTQQASNDKNLVPGGMGSLGFLGMASTGFLGSEVVQGISEVWGATAVVAAMVPV
jgi:tyrosine-specific transport protein